MENWYRIIFLYVMLHVISFIIEVYRYKHSHWNFRYFIQDGMTTMTYILLVWDLVFGIIMILVWAVKPMIG